MFFFSPYVVGGFFVCLFTGSQISRLLRFALQDFKKVNGPLWDRRAALAYPLLCFPE